MVFFLYIRVEFSLIQESFMTEARKIVVCSLRVAGIMSFFAVTVLFLLEIYCIPQPFQDIIMFISLKFLELLGSHRK